jgi:ATP-binding cassette subfamily F protein uup
LLDQGFEQFEEWRDAILEQEQVDHHKLKRKIAAEQDWVRYGVSGRRKRNQRRLKELRGLQTRSRTVTKRPAIADIETLETDVSGRKVIDVRNLSFAYDEKMLVDTFSVRILRGEKIGLVGPNGSGKTTLIKLLTGELTPDSGQVKLGTNLQKVSLDQNRKELRHGQLLQEFLTDGHGDQVMVGDTPRHVISYMKDFLFSANQARTPVANLSGGEQGRLMLARALARPSNIIVLDEPTNDLDLETLDVLQELLGDYEGTLLLVSHDRDFLDRTATTIIAYEGDGHWQRYPGGYSDMMVQRRPAPVEAEPVERRTKTRPAAVEPVPSAVRKLTFKDKHALEKLPGEMDALQKKITDTQKRLADPDLFQSDRAKFDRLGASLDKALSQLEVAEEEWLRLEMLREEIAGG